MKKILFTGFMASILSIAGAYAVADNDGYLTTKSYVDDAAMWATKQGNWTATEGQKGYIANKPTIPATTSQLTNDSGFITSAALPTKVSDLNNDSNFATTTQVATAKSEAITAAEAYADGLANNYATTAQGALADSAVQPNDNVSTLTNDAGYITDADIPTSLSEFTNDENFIDRTDISATGAIAYNNTTGVISVASGYTVPTSTALHLTCGTGEVCVVTDAGTLQSVNTISNWTDL